MTDGEKRLIVKTCLDESLEVKRKTVEENANLIINLASIIADQLDLGNKILICGNGGSAADSQHLAAEFVGRFQYERRPLPALALTTDTSALTAIGNDYAFEDIFARQVVAYAHVDDILLAISTSGKSENVIRAIVKAKQNDMGVIALVGNYPDSPIAQLADWTICVKSKSTPRIQETHIFIGHMICDLVEREFVK